LVCRHEILSPYEWNWAESIDRVLRSKLKKIPSLYAVNVRVKAALCKRNYVSLRTHFESEARRRGVFYDEADVPAQVRRLLAGRRINSEPVSKGQLRIIYVGTDLGQDLGGIIQTLKRFGEVILFECEPGRYGQTPKRITKDRAMNNGRQLIRLIEQATNKRPIHAVIGQMWGLTMDSAALQKVRGMGIVVVNISMDDRHAFRGRRTYRGWSGTSGLIGAIDLACTAAKECCLWYRVEGCPAIYLPEASDPELYGSSSEEKCYDVCFVGKNYGVRSEIVRAIEKDGVEVTCYGKDWPNGRVAVEDLPGLFTRSRIILGIGTIGHCTDFYALKMRDFDGPMSGSLYLAHDNPDLYDLYEVGSEIVTYRTPDECADKVVYYLNHSNEANIIAKAGRARAVKEHTWEKRFEWTFKVLGLLL